MKRMLLVIFLMIPIRILFAQNTIEISLHGDSSIIGAIGLSYVDNGVHKEGNIGSNYHGEGFKPGLLYKFGYRTGIFSKNYSCGSAILNQSANIIFDISNKDCKPIIQFY